MRIELRILDEQGKVVAKHEADACQPSQWKATSGQRFVSPMPQQSDQRNTGTYELFGITIQPHVRVDRPNGWTEPPPQPISPFTGQQIQNPWSTPNPPTTARPFAQMVGTKDPF